ncbi:glycosyltransferase family 4 protein [Limosilactobacillus pontis]|uniref:glycosyltransferase family 4 protein n=1 Tax=Limosilactobacillus pontis TaxID=35787 RepID=UPI002F268A32
MVFEYANRLVNEGCDVYILFLNGETFQKYHLPLFIRRILCNIFTKIEPRWFNLDRRVKKVSNLDYNYKNKLGKLNAVIATSAEKTVKEVYSNLNAEKKYYFIQGYEDWNVSKEFVNNTFKLGLNNIVISKWLKEKVDSISGKPSVLIPNALDTEIYKKKIAMSKRESHTIALLYHEEKNKGLANAFKVLKVIKEKYPDLKVKMFGQFPEPNLPKWIKYYRNASQAETVNIYNSSQVFLCSTIEEGFGLTGFEAMACGSCLVSTNYKGVREYAIDGYNALLSPVGDIKGQVDNVVRIFEDPLLREKLSINGVNSAKEHSWSEAMKRFNKVLCINQ